MWQIILVDTNNDLRNGGIAYLKEADMAEKEAWSRAKHMEDEFGIKIKCVLCERKPA